MLIFINIKDIPRSRPQGMSQPSLRSHWPSTLVPSINIASLPFPVKRKGTASDWCVGFGVFQFSTKAVP